MLEYTGTAFTTPLPKKLKLNVHIILFPLESPPSPVPCVPVTRAAAGSAAGDTGGVLEDRGQRTEDRGQRTEDRGQRTEDS